MDVRIETLPPFRVVAYRHVGPFHLIGDKFREIWKWVTDQNVPALGALGWWHDNPLQVAESELRSDACVIVPQDFVLENTGGLDLRVDTVGGGEYAVYTHRGNYEGLGEAWGAFMADGIPSLGRSPGKGDNFEVYVDDCSKMPFEEVRTELYAPLAPKG